jgi:hypothetical protein
VKAKNKFAKVVTKKIDGFRYKLSADSWGTFVHPSLNELGRLAHAHWFDIDFRGYRRPSRRGQLIQIANELLLELDDPDFLQVVLPDVDRVDPALLAFAQKLTVDPLDVKQCLIGFALSSALQIIDANEPLDERHYMGGAVYGPLLILEGLLMAQGANKANQGEDWDRQKLLKEHADYVALHGKERGWRKFGAARYDVTPTHFGRVWNKMQRSG